MLRLALCLEIVFSVLFLLKFAYNIYELASYKHFYKLKEKKGGFPNIPGLDFEKAYSQKISRIKDDILHHLIFLMVTLGVLFLTIAVIDITNKKVVIKDEIHIVEEYTLSNSDFEDNPIEMNFSALNGSGELYIIYDSEISTPALKKYQKVSAYDTTIFVKLLLGIYDTKVIYYELCLPQAQQM